MNDYHDAIWGDRQPTEAQERAFFMRNRREVALRQADKLTARELDTTGD